MSPALEPGDYLVTRAGGRLRRGGIVVFEHPHRPGFLLVKRLAGLPGDEVDLDGRTVRVAEGEVIVLSDARTLTRADSRTFGPVPLDRVERVVFRYWPPRRLGFVRPTIPT